MTSKACHPLLPIIALCAVGMATARAETVTYFATDHLGSPVAVMDSSGSVIWRESYTPYGEKRENPSGGDNDTGYTGHQFDAVTDLTYMQARYYDPVVGRFMAVDPVGFRAVNPRSFNRYGYANYNPYRYVDPDGQYARGSGFTDKQWNKFNKAQQRAAKAMGKRAVKLDAKAAKLDAKGKPGGDGSRAMANSLRAGATALKSDQYVANAVTQGEYEAGGGTPGGGGAAYVPSNDKTRMIVNVDSTGWNVSSRERARIVGHESLHSAISGLSDRPGSNKEKAYKYGTDAQRESFKELTGTIQSVINPDHVMDTVY